MIIYQIYLRSFKDSNNDGIGDFKGLISKLDYLQDLGVNAVWVSPHYQSPMDDNGYDISNFFEVSNDYGTLEDCKAFINQAHERNMHVIFDLVLNHTSDENPAKDPSHPEHKKYHDYYIWQPPKYDQHGVRQMPTNWRSWFGGPVWEYNEPTNEYYLHIFSKKMPDLNWRNEDMKNDLKEVAKFWIDLGVDGFRVDASNHLEKNWDFPEAHPGYEHFSSLPKHHEYLEEFGTELFYPNDIMTMGEAGGATKEEALKYCGFDNREFDMFIHFGHCWADCDDHNHVTPGKWAKGELHVSKVKESFNKWYEMLYGQGWNLIYWHNHDHPRIVSHYGDDKQYHKQSAKMLAQSLYLMPGTPIVYQGEEIGMTNVDYDNLTDFRDVEVYTEYDNFKSFGASHDVALQALRDRSRDSARSPYQWDSSPYSGFTNTTPWMNVNRNYTTLNLKEQQQDSTSIYHTYQSLFKIRKELDIANGKIQFFDLESDDSFVYENVIGQTTIYVLSNFRNYEIDVQVDVDIEGYTPVMSNYKNRSLHKKMRLQPYESLVYLKK